jgi:hypothetical protein
MMTPSEMTSMAARSSANSTMATPITANVAHICIMFAQSVPARIIEFRLPPRQGGNAGEGTSPVPGC